MFKTDPILVEKCRRLRKKGFTLGEIVKKTGLPKTTVYDHIRDIPLSNVLKEKIKKYGEKLQKRQILERAISSYQK